MVFAFAFPFFAQIGKHGLQKGLRQRVLEGFIVHSAGSLLRYYILYDYYSGGDAGRYYRWGLQYAARIWHLDFSFLLNTGFGWGTQNTMFITGFMLSAIGPTKRGGFFVFALLAFLGLYLMLRAFQRNYPDSSAMKYATWLFFWPSLWFWPASIGKDALVLLATCMVVYGYCGAARISLMPMVAGLGLAGFLRPHVAGVLVVSIAVAHWFSPGKKRGKGHYLQGFLIMILLFFVVREGFSKLGVGNVDFDNVKEFVDSVSHRTSQGGSNISTPGFTLLGIPMAFVNILFRPFLWEAGNIMMVASALEMTLFWLVFWKRRRTIAAVAVRWRETRLMRLAIPLTLLYTLMLGLAFGNLGIIARQRIHVMPFLLLWLAVEPRRIVQTVPKAPGPAVSRPFLKVPAMLNRS